MANPRETGSAAPAKAGGHCLAAMLALGLCVFPWTTGVGHWLNNPNFTLFSPSFL